MKFLDNIYDPEAPNARQYIRRSHDETREEAWQRQKRWLSGKIIGDPQGTDTYTVAELKAFGMVGVYDPNS